MSHATLRKLSPVLALIFVVSWIGCAPGAGQRVGGTYDRNQKTVLGSAAGAAAGGLIAAGAGGGTTAIIGGVLLGGLLGGAIGNALDQRDRELAARTTQYALETTPSGTASSWKNPDSGHYGTVTPTRTYQAASGQYCREFQQTVVVGGEQQQAYGTACRMPDGSWQVQ